MGTRRLVVCAVLLAALATAGCGDGGTNGTAEPGGTVTPSSPAGSPGGLPPSFRATPSPPGKSVPPGEQTLSGRVEAGVEAGCLIMRTAKETYLLVGGDKSVVREGAQVTVRGRPAPDLMTTCQQGVPFQVTEARLG